MATQAILKSISQGFADLALRPASQVMQLDRLGAMHQSRLSFMRSLVRKISREQWQISVRHQNLCKDGYGELIYRIQTAHDLFEMVIFSNYLADEERNDRVIAGKWDLTMALVHGVIEADYLENLRANVPLQEAGRVDARVFVLSRANHSSRNFAYIVDCLAKGEQPDIDKIIKVGYLYRTTAVYGSGKLGMADWDKVKSHYPDFARPFAAEMFVCYMLRSFSLFQAEHIAANKNQAQSCKLAPQIKRYFGIGNSTGLGMAPYLINHPVLFNQWITIKEYAFAAVRKMGVIDADITARFLQLLTRAKINLQETYTEDEWQTQCNANSIKELEQVMAKVKQRFDNWQAFFDWLQGACSIQTNELCISIALELYPQLVDYLENNHCVEEVMQLNATMSCAQLLAIIEDKYAWALAIDFSKQANKSLFWYRSEEKLEPRLGSCNLDVGENKQMALGIGFLVSECHQALAAYIHEQPEEDVASFLVAQPKFRGIVRRIQKMAKLHYGDIQANLLAADILPMHLLRAKLSFFGVSKFDPRSKLWVRNTMFQGAPLLEDIGTHFDDDWFMPLAPTLEDQ